MRTARAGLGPCRAEAGRQVQNPGHPVARLDLIHRQPIAHPLTSAPPVTGARMRCRPAGGAACQELREKGLAGIDSEQGRLRVDPFPLGLSLGLAARSGGFPMISRRPPSCKAEIVAVERHPRSQERNCGPEVECAAAPRSRFQGGRTCAILHPVFWLPCRAAVFGFLPARSGRSRSEEGGRCRFLRVTLPGSAVPAGGNRVGLGLWRNRRLPSHCAGERE